MRITWTRPERFWSIFYIWPLLIYTCPSSSTALKGRACYVDTNLTCLCSLVSFSRTHFEHRNSLNTSGMFLIYLLHLTMRRNIHQIRAHCHIFFLSMQTFQHKTLRVALVLCMSGVRMTDVPPYIYCKHWCTVYVRLAQARPSNLLGIVLNIGLGFLLS